MTAAEAIVANLKTAQLMFFMLTDDLTDADLLVRPVPGANHLAWQWGHLIATEHRFLANIGHAPAPLPDGFAEKHKSATAGLDAADAFCTKDMYRTTYAAVRAATIAAAEQTTPEEFDRPNVGPLERIAPTIGALYLLIASHSTMHIGQASVLRRKLGKPVMF